MVYVSPTAASLLADVDFADVCITSDISVVAGPVPDGAFTQADAPDVGVTFVAAEGDKCERCWKVLPDVGSVAEHPTLCPRCADAVDAG